MATSKKKAVREMLPASMPLNDDHCDSCCAECGPKWGGEFGRKILWTLVGVLLVYLVFFVGTLTRNSIKQFSYIGQADQTERTITVTGYGKVSGSNDIAVTSIGFTNTNADVAVAQLTNKKVMDSVLAELKKMGIADADLQSNYSIYPEYDYTADNGRNLKGYTVTNNVTVKIRDLSKIPAVLELAGKFGANQVGNLNFTIDDPENLRNMARDKALLDAKQKAAALAARLGVQVVAVVSYNEFDANTYPVISPMYSQKALDTAVGGSAPEAVAGGSQDVAMNVNVTYKIVSQY